MPVNLACSVWPINITAVSAGIEIFRIKFGGNPTFPFCSPQIFSLMVMKIIPVLVALQAILLSVAAQTSS